MARSYEDIAINKNKLTEIGSNNYFRDANKDVQNFYLYEKFPYVYITDAFCNQNNNLSYFYCTDVTSITNSKQNVYNHYDEWNEIYNGFPYTYYDNSTYTEYYEGEEEYEVTIERARPTFVVPGTRPTFSKVLYSNISGIGINTIDGGLTGTVNLVTITRTDSKLTIYAKRNWDNLSISKDFYASDFSDNVIPKRLLIEIQGVGGGGGKGGTGVGGSVGNGGGAGGYWCGIININNVYSWRIDAPYGGEAGTSSGGAGGDGGNTILSYFPYSWSTTGTESVIVEGGAGANKASSTTQANGGGVTLSDTNYCYTLTTRRGGAGGTTRSGGYDAESTPEIYVRCTNLSGSYDAPICVTRGNKPGGALKGGNGGGASYFRDGAPGGQWVSGGYSKCDGKVGSGGGGSEYDFRDSPPAGIGGEAGIVIWY